jgi:3-oxoacyl-[acyl-carrier-protein] synthase II
VGATVAVTGWAVHVPGEDLSGLVPGLRGSPAPPAEHAHELLGRRGLLAKEPATRLALCAVHRALGLAAGAPPGRAGSPDPATAVVAASNLGNVATVCDMARTVLHGSVRDVSPMDAPNASSNVIASSVAIWFRLGGPNLMVCSGATSGLDAAALGRLLLRAGRARRVVVVGAEPDDEDAAALQPGLRAAAAAVVLEPGGVPGWPRLELGRHAAARPEPTAPTLIGPAGPGARALRVIDLTSRLGDTSGALGVLQLALGAALVAAGEPSVALVCGDEVDGWRQASIREAGT